MSMTTAMGKNFRAENITYQHARTQSEIENEIEKIPSAEVFPKRLPQRSFALPVQ